MLFISDAQYYVPIKLCRMPGSIHLFKITGTKLKQNLIWDIIEIDWKGVNMTLNGNKVNLTNSVTLKFQDKFKIRLHWQKRTFAFSYYVKARFTLVHIGFQQFSRNSISQPRYSSRNCS